MICAICKKEITDVAYVSIKSSVVITNKNIPEERAYFNKAHRDLYNRELCLHDNCWIQLIGTNTGLVINGGLGIVDKSQ